MKLYFWSFLMKWIYEHLLIMDSFQLCEHMTISAWCACLVTKRYKKKILPDIGLRFSDFGSEIVKNRRAEKKVYFWVFATHCWWIYVKISSSILLCIKGELAGSPAAHLPHPSRSPFTPLLLPFRSPTAPILLPFRSPSVPLPFPFRSNFFLMKTNKINFIGATICIGQKIQCLQYAGFFIWQGESSTNR